ncbi:MAG: hypothetical protein ACOY0S_00260 [Patescibacteria group bacterium]
MKKHSVRHSRRTIPASRKRDGGHYLVIVRSWMLIVVFALMLGVGAIVGRFFNEKLNEATPSVAGVSVEAK